MAKRTLEIALATGFILLAVATFCAWASPTTEYEPSIYSATPIVVWVCFFLAIACSIIATIGSLYFCKERNKLWVLGLVLITLSYVFILALYVVRGYAMVGASGDAGTHFGYIKDIISVHHFTYSSLPYPMTHIFLAQLSLITSISPIVLMKLATAFMAMLYVGFMYLLAGSLFHGTRITVLITLSASCTFFGYTLLFPNNLADLALPMALFVLFKSFGERAWGWRVLFLTILLFFPMFHQVTSVALAAVLMVALVVYSFAAKHKRSVWLTLGINVLAFAFLIAWIVLWQLPHIQYGYIPSLVPADQSDVILSPSGMPTNTSHIHRLVTEIHYVSSYGYNITEQFFKQYGILLVYLILALAALPLLLKNKVENWKAITLYGALIGIGLMIIALFFTAIFGGPYRYVMYLSILSPVFAGFTLYALIKWARAKHKPIYISVLSLVILLLLGVATNSTLLKYYSSYTLTPNLQNTEPELEGSGWFIDNKNLTLQTSGWTFPLSQYVDYHLGYRALYSNTKVYRLPRHFGYDEHDMMGQNFGNDTYFVLTELNRRYYVDVLPKMATDFLLPSDFDRIDNDPSANQIYTNGGLDIWYVYAKDAK